MSQQDNKEMAKYFYRASAADFKKIPGSPVAYWATANMLKAFTGNQPLHCIATPRAGMITGNNAKFVRLFHEVNCSKISFDSISRSTAKNSGKRWFPYQKGGPFRKYYGNMEYVVDWEDDGHRLRYTIDAKGKVPAHAFNEEYIFRANVNWSAVTSGSFSSRITVSGSLFDASGSAAFPDDPELVYIISSFLNSPIARMMISFINPTLNFQAWEIGSLPLLKASLQVLTQIINNTKTLRVYAKTDWDIQESAWDFSRHPCVCLNFCQPSLISTYQKVRAKWLETTLEMQRLEEENNRIFIGARGKPRRSGRG